MLEKLGMRLKNLREGRDMKQIQVAKLLHTSQQNYSKYENAQVELPLAILVELADLYDVSVDYLLGRSSTQKELDIIVQQQIGDRSIIDLINDIESLNTNHRLSLLDYLDYLKSKEK